MAHISKRVRSGQTVFRVRYLDPAGRPRERWFDRRADARRFQVSTEAAVLKGEYIDPVGGQRAFAKVAEEWREVQLHDASTVDQVGSHLRNHILPFFGQRPLAGIRPSHVQAFVAGMVSKGLAPSTVEVIYRYVASIFKMGVRDRLIVASPCIDVRLPSTARPPVAPPTTEDVKAVHGALPPRYRALVVVAAGSGLRQAEVLGLTVPHVEFLRRDLRVVQQLKLVLGRPPFLDDLKTPSSYRTVPVADVVLEALAEHLRAFPPTTTLTGYRSGQPEALVFTNYAGGAVRRNGFGEVWRAATDRAGLASDLTFHGLRHYYASLLIRQGASVKAVQARLGHKSAKETLDTYTNLWPDDDDLTRTAVQAVLGAEFGPEGGRDGGSQPLRHTSAHVRVINGDEPACTPDSVQAPERPGRPSLSAGGCPPALAAYPGVLVGRATHPPV